jgi:hypothetical protein
LVSYQLRTNYLNTIADGVGERLITINDAFLNTAGFKAAGWRPNPANIKRTHSPPIPTAIASEYFQAPPRSAGLTGLDDEVEEGGMVTGGGAGDTVGPGIATKRRRRREQMEEEDSSDLSDESDEDAYQESIRFISNSRIQSPAVINCYVSIKNTWWANEKRIPISSGSCEGESQTRYCDEQ